VKNQMLALFVVLTLNGVAQAQFNLKGYAGNRMKNASRPDARYRFEGGAGSSFSTDYYFRWGKDHVQIQSVNIGPEEKPRVSKSLFYYADFSPETTKVIPTELAGAEGFDCTLLSKNGTTIPMYSLSRTYYSEDMQAQVMVQFATKEQGEAFLKKITAKKQSVGSARPARVMLKKRVSGRE
jgi:hypothetical protein